MARSMTIVQEEQASTNPLLTGFLLLSMAFLMIGAIVWGAEDVEAAPVSVELAE